MALVSLNRVRAQVELLARQLDKADVSDAGLAKLAAPGLKTDSGCLREAVTRTAHSVSSFEHMNATDAQDRLKREAKVQLGLAGDQLEKLDSDGDGFIEWNEAFKSDGQPHNGLPRLASSLFELIASKSE